MVIYVYMYAVPTYLETQYPHPLLLLRNLKIVIIKKHYNLVGNNN